MQRRSVLRLGAVATGVFLCGGAQGLVLARGQTSRVAVPTVERLVLTSTIDGSYDRVLPSGQVGTISVQRTAFQPTLVAEHGLGYSFESFIGEQRRSILLDFGNTYQNLSWNYAALKVEPVTVDGLILSHGHADHYGGLLELASATPAWAERSMRVYAGGEDTFCRRLTVAADGTRSAGATLDESEIRARGVEVVLAKTPTVVSDHALVTGQIPRTTDFETALVNGLPVSATAQTGRLEVGPSGSICGDVSHFQPTLVEGQEGDIVPDLFQGELATIYNVRDRGLVVISSRGHSGIINTVRYAQAVTGVEKVHAVVGGIHLAAAPDAIVARTVDALQQINPDYFVPMHCTGFYPALMIEHVLPKRVVEPSSGTRILFGS